MYLTQDDYRKIEKWFQQNTVKDVDFPEACPLKGEEVIAIVQNGHNKKIAIRDLVNQIFELGVSDFLNVTDKYNAHHITLCDAIKLIPSKARKAGQVITFLNTEGNWEIYQFKGVLNQWNHTDLWEDLFNFDKLIVDSILPDEEDLTKSEPDEKGNSYLSLKDKEYNPEEFSGFGKVILRKNIVEIEDPVKGKIKKNILYQDMMLKANTIYIIQYDFDLNGEEIIVPENCVLKFEGGSLSNGTINGTDTSIEAGFKKIFDANINIIGNLRVYEPKAEWFGAVPNKVDIDNSESFQKTLNYFGTIYLIAHGIYYFNNPILLNNTNYIIGNNSILSFTIKDSENPCCIKMGANCVVQDITIEIDEINSIENVSGVWFQSDYRRKTLDATNSYNAINRSAEMYAVRNIIIKLKNNNISTHTFYKIIGIKVTGEDNPISSGIAFNFAIKNGFDYGIFVDLSNSSVPTKEGWFTAGRFTNGSIGFSRVNIYIDSSSTQTKNVSPTGLVFSNISIQTQANHVTSLFDKGIETRAIILGDCKDIVFKDCYIWDWPKLGKQTYYDTPAPILLSSKSLNIIFDNTGCEYIKLYELSTPFTALFLDNPPTVKNRNTLRFNEHGFQENMSKDNFTKLFLTIPSGNYTINKSILKLFILHSSTISPLYIDNIENLIITNNASLQITDHNMFRTFEIEIGIINFTTYSTNSYYCYKCIIPASSNIINENWSDISFMWFRVFIDSISNKIRYNRTDANNKGEYYIDLSRENLVSFCSGDKHWTDANGYTVCSHRGVTNNRPQVSTDSPTPNGYITSKDKGLQYFDTTLNKPIWWTGSKWVDANGADV